MAGAFTGSSTGISVSIAAVDQTAAAFRGVAARASALKSQVSGIGAGFKSLALAALPLVSVAAVIKSAGNAFREMSVLTDRAADVGSSAGDLQRLVGVMQQLGARGANIETISRAMQRMTRETGEVGMTGFAKVLATASRLGTEAERVDFLMQAFGRNQGLVFAKMIRDGDAGVVKLLEMAGAYPAVSEAAANAGDRAADALARAADAIKAGWWNMLGSLVVGFEAAFGPLPEVAAAVSNGIVISFKAVTDTVRFIVLVLRSMIEPVARTIALLVQSVGYLTQAVTDSSYSFSDAFSDIGLAARDHVRDFADAWKESAEGIYDFSGIGASAASGFSDAIQAALHGGVVTFRKDVAKAAGDFGKAISNSFSKGGSFALKGSNEARKIIMGDPWKDNAARSQRTVTQYLPRIAEGIERTVSRIGDMVDTFDDLEAI